jgi:hypothetical protein
MAEIGWFREVYGEQIQLTPLSIDIQKDYPILYWKKLPTAHVASFSVEKAEPGWINGRNGEPNWFREGKFCASKWHTEPWDLQAWPSN